MTTLYYPSRGHVFSTKVERTLGATEIPYKSVNIRIMIYSQILLDLLEL